jgi:hypothetical protein
MSEMNTTKRIIAGLTQLEAGMKKFEAKEWLATRKKMGADIDPENVDVRFEYAQVLDPYGLCPSFPEELYQIGREYFARPSKTDAWVSFDDLSKMTVDRLWQRMRAGEFDTPSSAADWFGSIMSKPTLAALANSHGLSPNKMLWQPTVGAFEAVNVAGRVLVRSTIQSCGRLIVKDTDLDGSLFVLTIREGGGRFRLGGWMDVRVAKQFPSLGAAAHFVDQRQLGDMDDLKQFPESSLKDWKERTSRGTTL